MLEKLLFKTIKWNVDESKHRRLKLIRKISAFIGSTLFFFLFILLFYITGLSFFNKIYRVDPWAIYSEVMFRQFLSSQVNFTKYNFCEFLGSRTKELIRALDADYALYYNLSTFPSHGS